MIDIVQYFNHAWGKYKSLPMADNAQPISHGVGFRTVRWADIIDTRGDLAAQTDGLLISDTFTEKDMSDLSKYKDTIEND